MSMWEPFTKLAQHSISIARDEAIRLGNTDVGTEHILLGIIAQGDTVAARALDMLGIDLAKVRREVEANTGSGAPPIRDAMRFTPDAKRVMELAFEEARMQNHNYVGTESLLLGIIREPDGLGGRVLKDAGVDATRVREQMTALLREDKPPAP
ncbi:MAG: ATP-dependent Clp protease ATP-binding subunit ClpC [Candidatus Eremiobacteraeota bacterium]|jgi:ATP-dependent Clp protease ATP-binding subunit ClpC|nr:ATP-dependent Clp protease ATP-binding subunit ClpC [Candidatus Eremiobacteraeota bacterium]